MIKWTIINEQIKELELFKNPRSDQPDSPGEEGLSDGELPQTFFTVLNLNMNIYLRYSIIIILKNAWGSDVKSTLTSVGWLWHWSQSIIQYEFATLLTLAP